MHAYGRCVTVIGTSGNMLIVCERVIWLKWFVCFNLFAEISASKGLGLGKSTPKLMASSHWVWAEFIPPDDDLIRIPRIEHDINHGASDSHRINRPIRQQTAKSINSSTISSNFVIHPMTVCHWLRAPFLKGPICKWVCVLLKSNCFRFSPTVFFSTHRADDRKTVIHAKRLIENDGVFFGYPRHRRPESPSTRIITS